jgi:hypothetical protein
MSGANGKGEDPTKSLAQMVQDRLTFKMEETESRKEGEEWRDRLQPLGETTADVTQ